MKSLQTGRSKCSRSECEIEHRRAAKGPIRVHAGFSKDLMRQLLLLIAVIVAVPVFAFSQNSTAPDSIQSLTLAQCIDFAMQHQPGLNQSLVNRAIVSTTNSINLAGWMPQVSLTGNMTHYYQLPTSFAASSTPGGAPIESHPGVTNTAIPEFSASQAIFDPQLLYAARSAPSTLRQAEQSTDSARISVVSTVSKSFYSLLLTLEQISVLKEDTARLSRNVMDTYHQSVGGIVDETDYEQAVIALNNSKAQLKQQMENVVPQYAALKQLMGCPPEKQFNVVFDTVQMMQEIAYDTTQALQYEKRIEYQQIQTAKTLQHERTMYYEFSFLPSVSAVYNYYYEFENNSSANLFKTAYPYSYFGLSFSFPLFTGFSRVENLHKSMLQEEVLDWAEKNLRSQIYTEYTTALANYRSNLYSWQLLKENRGRASNVYRVVSLQYNQGIVAYLNMIVAESNLITAEIGYLNALFQLLSSKIDLEKAMGEIPHIH